MEKRKRIIITENNSNAKRILEYFRKSKADLKKEMDAKIALYGWEKYKG
jgi:hypothetical protein